MKLPAWNAGSILTSQHKAVGELASAVDRFFASDGPLVSRCKDFRYRQGQHAMAMEVASTIEGNSVLVIEAGTGIGKTFAYLASVLLGPGKAVISTATKALQDQLLLKDLPLLQALLNSHVRAVALKGRSSYICLQRLEEAIQTPELVKKAPLALWERLNAWSRRTVVGDLAEFAELQEDSGLMPAITSTRDNCLGATCPQVARCHVNRARREAMQADLVVVNHHLFFADLQIRESGVAELLPMASTVVFDEAHQLNDIGVQFLGRHLTSTQLASFLRHVQAVTARHAQGWRAWPELLNRCEMQLSIAGELAAGLKSRAIWGENAPQGINADLWVTCLNGLSTALDALLDALLSVADSALEFRTTLARGERLSALLQVFTGSPQAGVLRWVDPGRPLRMVSSPLDISQSMQAQVFGLEIARTPKAWIFTSATLGADAGLTWFTRSCGLSDARVVRLQGPFDYAKQSSIYIPHAFAAAGGAAHSLQVADLVAKAAGLLGGRTMVLATTLKAMRAIADSLVQTLGATPYQVLVQGHAPKLTLLAQFRQAGLDGCGPAVLVASASFWDGVDIPGDTLQLLVIDKLPFSPPDDPIQQARAAQIEASGGNAFRELHLSQAAVALRQGAGRLIRSETDRGVLVICDTRLLSASYGKKLLACLPPMRRLETHEEFTQALQALTKTSTMDCPEPLRLG